MNALPADPDGLCRLLSSLERASREFLEPLPAEAIAEALREVSRRFLDPEDEVRREAVALLPASTGFSAPMVARALDLTFTPLSGKDLLGRLAGVRPGATISLVFAAGAIPDPVVRSVYRLLLGKSAVLVKCSSTDPVLPPLLEGALLSVRPDLGRCLAARRWVGGDETLEALAFEASSRVIAYGSDETIEALRVRVPPRVEFLGHGHRVSIAVLGRSALGSLSAVHRLGEELALDAVLYDQRGCLSLQAIYVEKGGIHTALDLVRQIAGALDRLERELPRGPLPSLEVARFHSECSLARMRAREVLASRNALWAVVLEGGVDFRPSPLGRFLRVYELGSLQEFSFGALPLQGMALAPLDLAHWIAPAGVRVCPPVTLQSPPLDWLET